VGRPRPLAAAVAAAMAAAAMAAEAEDTAAVVVAVVVAVAAVAGAADTIPDRRSSTEIPTARRPWSGRSSAPAGSAIEPVGHLHR